MYQHKHSLSRFRRLASRRGAVFLLAVYCTSLLLLILSGVALQRTMTDTRVAQQSTDLQQAFYSADGVMDYALAKTRRYYLDDGACYSAVPVAGRPALCTDEEAAHGSSFTLVPMSSEIVTQGKQQILTRQLVATGVAGSQASRRTSVVSTYVKEEGPLEGSWSNRLVAVYGGGHYGQLPEHYLKGSLRSNRGVLAAELANAQYDSLTTLSGKSVVMSGAVKATDWQDLVNPANDYVSSELLTVKNEYLNSHTGFGFMGFGGGLPEYRDPVVYRGVQYPGVNYYEGQHEDTFPHINGGASIGSVKQPIHPPTLLSGIQESDCNGDLVLTDAFNTTHIGDGFQSADKKVHDLSTDPNFIILCVNAIYPQGTQAWKDTYESRPLKLAFEKPAILYVTGSKQVTPADVDPALYDKIGGWDFAIGAEISSAMDASGKPIPDGLKIAVRNKQPNAKRTVVWMEPAKFSGSIFAPESFVVLLERDTRQFDFQTNKLIPLHLQHLVGDEVIIQLAYDELTLGTLDDDRKKPATAKTTWLGGWMNHSASVTGSGTDSKTSKSKSADPKKNSK